MIKQIAPARIKAINLADYLIIPDSSTIISKYELQGYNNLNWQDTHSKLNDNGLFMPTPAKFVNHFKNVVDAYQGRTKLYDGAEKQIKNSEIEDIYKHLTKSYITIYKKGSEGCWTWLDAYFEKQKNGFYIRTQNKTKKEKLEDCIQEDCYVNLKFNKQGLPIEKSNKQIYEQGKNIYYWTPRDGAVARFYAISGRANLLCSGNPGELDSWLGVFACAENLRSKK